MQKTVKMTLKGKTSMTWASGQNIHEFEKEINPRGYFDSVLGLYAKGGPVNRGLCLPYKNYSMHRLPIYKYITYTCSGYAYKISERYT